VTERLLENVCTAQPSFIHKQQQQSSKAQQRLPSSKSPFQSLLLLLLQRSLEPSRITFFLSSLSILSTWPFPSSLLFISFYPELGSSSGLYSRSSFFIINTPSPNTDRVTSVVDTRPPSRSTTLTTLNLPPREPKILKNKIKLSPFFS
jgi:hypothetical protein